MQLTNSYSNYTYFKKHFVPQQQSFKGLSVGAKIKAAGYTFVGLSTLSLLSQLSLNSIESNQTEYTPEYSTKNGWSDNVKVLAPNSQQWVSCSLDSSEYANSNAFIQSMYGDELLHKILEKDVNSLVDAHKIIEKKGMLAGDTLSNNFILKTNSNEYTNQFPVSTPNSLDCWKKDDKTKQRFILAIGGSEERHTLDINKFSSMISDIYKVPESNIIKIKNANMKSITKGLEELKEKVKNLNKDNAEILIYYHGHGSAKNVVLFGWANQFKKEGAAKGRSEVGLKEEDLQKFTKEKLNDINTLIIMDTCLGGAWVCDNVAQDTCHFNQFV